MGGGSWRGCRWSTQQDAYNIFDAIIGYRRYPRELFQVSPREATLLREY